MAKSSSEPGSSRPARRRGRAEDREPKDPERGVAADHGNGGPAPARTEPVGSAAGNHPVARGNGPPAGDNQARFRIFVIDSGWNSPASKVLHENLPVLLGLTHIEPIYVLDRETSVMVMREHRDLIGKDPIISVHDLWAIERHGHAREHGFRMHLGLLLEPEKVLAALKMFAHFMAQFRRSRDLEKHVHRQLRLSGLAGAIEIVGGAAAHHTELMD